MELNNFSVSLKLHARELESDIPILKPHFLRLKKRTGQNSSCWPPWTLKKKMMGEQREGRVKKQRETTCQPGQHCTCPMSLLEQLQDADNDVVNVTKPRCLWDREMKSHQNRINAEPGPQKEEYADLPHYLKLFGMMQAPCPVYRNVANLRKEREVKSRWQHGHNNLAPTSTCSAPWPTNIFLSFPAPVEAFPKLHLGHQPSFGDTRSILDYSYDLQSLSDQ